MRRLAAVVLLVGVVWGCASAAPSLRVAGDVPADLHRLADELWPRFVAAFPARRECIGTVTIDLAWQMDDRARYLPDRRTIVVRAPATAPHLRDSIVHELGHHLEFSCPDQRNVRQAFLAAEGLPPDAGWFDGSDWASIPSEHWAEAVVAYVLGERDFNRGRIAVTDEAVQVVARWAQGG